MNPERFNASIKWSHADEIAQLYFRAKAGDRTLTDADIVLLGNFAGALNYARNGAAPPPPPPPAPAGSDFCDPNEDIRWMVTWGDYTRYCTRDVRDFRYNNVCFAFTVPADISKPFAVGGYVSLAEFDGSPTLRQMTISRSACDFRPVDPAGMNGPFASSYGKQVTLDFNVFAAQTGVALKPGETYYVNVRNWNGTDHGVIAADDPVFPGIGYAAGISVIWPHD